MSRLSKVLCAFVAVAAIAMTAASCGSGTSQVRVVQTVSNSGTINFDIAINGRTYFMNVPFRTVEPSTNYEDVSSGNGSFEMFQAGTTIPVINSTTLNMAQSTQYTVLAMGLVGGAGATSPGAVQLTDNNSPPSSGNAEFRIVNASPSAPGGNIDIYIVPTTNQNISGISPTISGLGYTQASSYQTEPAGSWTIIVAPAGTKTVYVNASYSVNAGQIRTVVLVNQQGIGAISGTPILLNDLH
jgi:hypothetical protein